MTFCHKPPEKMGWILVSFSLKMVWNNRISEIIANNPEVPKGIKPIPGHWSVPIPKWRDSIHIKREKNNQKRLLPIS
jgi:hypothetical protein